VKQSRSIDTFAGPRVWIEMCLPVRICVIV